MKSFVSACAAVLLAATWGRAIATADGPDHFQVTGVAADDTLNIRSEPSAKSAKIGEVPPQGVCIRNLGCQGGLTFEEFNTLSKEQQELRIKENPRWCRIEYQGIKGWVAGRYLTEGECAESAGTEQAGGGAMR